MELLFIILESLSFIDADAFSRSSKSKINEIIYSGVDIENPLFLLKIILISHIVYFDDNYISDSERKILEDFVIENKPLFTSNLNLLKSILSKNIWTEDDILNYVKYNEIDLLDVKEILNTFKKELFVEKKYHVVIENIIVKLKIKEYCLRRMLSSAK